jgi:acetyl-CoA carboxylase biotin carboxyl carrier protein
MDIRKIQKLIELLEHSQIAEVEIREGESSVRITRVPPAQPVVAPPPVWPAPVYHAAPPPAPGLPVTPASSPEPAAAPGGKAAVDLSHCITSPMVGTFYGATAPGQPPLVQVGSRVRRGDTVCIVEAMKIMNPIEADLEGTVTAVLVENGHPVEFGQPLFQLAP